MKFNPKGVCCFMKKRVSKQEILSRLYARILMASEIPIIESSDIHSKGIYMSDDKKKEIYIKQSLSVQEKLKVLLHEYSHHIHLTHYFNDESRSECEHIANGAAFFICNEYGLSIYKSIDLNKFTDDTAVITRLTETIRTVAEHILAAAQE